MGRTLSVSLRSTALPKGEPLAKRVGLVLIRQRQEEASVKLQTFRLCQSLSLSGEVARQSRDGEGLLPGVTLSVAYGDSCSPFCRLTATSSPGRGKSFEGGAFGKEGRSRPYSSTAGRSLPLSCKLYAFDKASPFRERWHGEAVTERVDFREEPSQSRCARQLVPLFVAYRRHLPPAGGSLSKGEPLAKRAGLVLIRQRQEEACR